VAAAFGDVFLVLDELFYHPVGEGFLQGLRGVQVFDG
jgi:hypothetical protein